MFSIRHTTLTNKWKLSYIYRKLHISLKNVFYWVSFVQVIWYTVLVGIQKVYETFSRTVYLTWVGIKHSKMLSNIRWEIKQTRHRRWTIWSRFAISCLTRINRSVILTAVSSNYCNHMEALCPSLASNIPYTIRIVPFIYEFMYIIIHMTVTFWILLNWTYCTRNWHKPFHVGTTSQAGETIGIV